MGPVVSFSDEDGAPTGQKKTHRACADYTEKTSLMASVVTYLLVSNPKDPDVVRTHPIIQKHGFEPQTANNGDESEPPALKFAVASALEDSSSLEAPCRKLSAAFPEATITFCEIEERFDQIEHVRSVVFIDGQQAGEIEHGYVFNVGT